MEHSTDRSTCASLIADPLRLSQRTAAQAIEAALMHPSIEFAIEKVERAMLELEQMPCPVIHRFAPGVYIREVTLPAGAFCIGAHQKQEHLNIMLKGKVLIRNKSGGVTQLTAPMVFVGEPGKKVGYVLEEVVWQNVYATTETDIEKLEAMFVDKGEAWQAAEDQRCRPTILDEIAREDYFSVLREYAIPHAVAQAQSFNTSDLTPFPHGGYKVMVTRSRIDGKGLFATAPIAKGEVIAPARVGEKRTPAGRYTNHSPHPNAAFVLRQNGDLDLVAIANISGMSGGLVGDEITIDYRQALEIRKKLCHQQSQQQ